MVWSGATTGIQSVTKLEVCERTKDEWLRSVQNEFRIGQLQPETHALLHGLPTMRPGRYFKGKVLCGNLSCIRRNKKVDAISELSLVKQQVFAAETLFRECAECERERNSRALVAWSSKDPRFEAEKFQSATAVFASNDIKYDVNKLRAQAFASKNMTGVMYCPAKDTPTLDALRVRPDLCAQQIHWLKRHDRESGDLCGILPIIKDMPVAMTDHIDRSADKRILRGRVGYVHSWVLSEKETSVFQHGKRVLTLMPKVVYVKFLNADGGELPWRISGLTENGLYPIVPVKREWFVD